MIPVSASPSEPGPPGNRILDFLEGATRYLLKAADGSDVPAVGPGFDVQYNATTLVPISDLVAAVDRLVLACNTALKVPRPVYDFEEPANPLPNTQVPVDTCLEYISTALTLAERTARPSVSRLVGGPSTFYAVALHCSAEDPWSSHKTASKANGKPLLDRFWPAVAIGNAPACSLQYASAILDDAVKPRLAGIRRSAVNSATGRPAKPILHRGLEAVADGRSFRTALVEFGLWHAVEEVVARVPTAHLEELWSRLVPPIVILLEDSNTACKAGGARAAKTLLEKVDSALLMRTGLDAVLGNLFELSYSFLDKDGAAELLLQTLHAHLALLDKAAEWDRRNDSARKTGFSPSLSSFMRLHRLVESALLHVAAYAPLSADKPALQRYMCEGMALVIPRLGVSVARYLQFFVPYLCQVLTSIEDTASPDTATRAVDVLALLSIACPPRTALWDGQIAVAASIASTKLQKTAGIPQGYDTLHERLEILSMRGPELGSRVS